MTVHILEDRRDTADNEPLSRELLLSAIGGDLYVLTLDAYGSNRLRCVGQSEVKNIYPDDALLRQLAQTLTAWFSDRDEWRALEDAKRAERLPNGDCSGNHATIDYQCSCPVCGWTNEIPF